MNVSLVWLFAVMALYCMYCAFWAASCGRRGGSVIEFFIASRDLPAWVFALTVTVCSFSGWVALGLPSIVFRDGFPAAGLCLAAVTIPLAGTLFFKRQWMLGKRFGFETPGELYGAYFRDETIRLLLLVIAVTFAIPFVGLQLSASGYVIQLLSGGAVSWTVAMFLMTSFVFLYACVGGLRAIASVSTLQCVLFGAGVIAVGLLAYDRMGGFGAFVDALGKLGQSQAGPWGASAQGYSAYLSAAGVMQFTAGLGIETPSGGAWTTTMVLSACIALMGIQASPAFSMLAFAGRSPKGFGPQQVWISAGVAGAILLFFMVGIGMGAQFLGHGTPAGVAGLAVANILPSLDDHSYSGLVAQYIVSLTDTAPWFMALLGVCAVAATHATAALISGTAGAMFSRDVYCRYLEPAANDRQQKFFARLATGLLMLASVLLASFAPRAQAQLGALALSFGFQLLPALAAICWLPWLTRDAVRVGLGVGMVAVILTEPLGGSITSFFGFELPWGRWPWTIHSAVWGMFFNLLFCLLVALATQKDSEREHRMRFHSFLDEYAGLPHEKRFLRPVAWVLALVWLFFALGPGSLLGNDFFGAPNKGPAAWVLGVPSLWGWQILWWALGVLVIWLLAYRMEMSVVPAGMIEPLPLQVPDEYHAEPTGDGHIKVVVNVAA